MKITARTALVVAVLLIYSSIIFPVPSNAAAYSNFEKALDLKILGLLANSPDNFELGRAPSRVEGAVMLVRLLGKEDKAKQDKLPHPFTDVPSWADHYVGYLYQNGLTKGIGDSRFGPNDLLSANQYITLVLRSLGYDDKTDFNYSQAIIKARQTGLLSSSESESLTGSSSFVRNDMIGISYNALGAKLKASNLTLLDKLVSTEKVIYKPAATVLGLYTADLRADYGGIGSYKPAVTSYGSVAKNKSDLFYLLRDMLAHTKGSLKIDTRSYSGSIAKDYKSSFDKAVRVVAELTGVENSVSSWEYLSDSNTFKLTVKYRYSQSELARRRDHARAAVNKARYAVAELVKADMSDYDKEKALHDYIVNTTRYDYTSYLKNSIPDESFSAYGCLVRGVAVCEGYSRAMKLLCDLSSLDCLVVSGKFKNGASWEGHAWNMIRVDGSYYHLDVTNDDPVIKNGGNILTYYYFNLPDSEMALTNTWKRSEYPSCTRVENSYYYKNSMVTDSRDAFEKAVQDALDLRRTIIELKVADYTEDGYSNLSDIIFRSRAVQSYKSLINEELGIIRIFNIQYS